MSICSENVQFYEEQRKAIPPKIQISPEQGLFLVLD